MTSTSTTFTSNDNFFFSIPPLLRYRSALAAPVHSLAIKSGSLGHPHLLISSYSRLHLPLLAAALLLASPHASPPSFNALISGFSLNSMPHHAFSAFRLMLRSTIPPNPITFLCLLPSCHLLCRERLMPLHGLLLKSGCASSLLVINATITSYGRCGDMNAAWKLFDGIPEWDVVSWNAVISAYERNGFAAEALEMYHQMVRRRFAPNEMTLVAMLSACASLGARHAGGEVDRIIRRDPDLQRNMFVGNALINMHARCGDLGRAREVFDRLPDRDIATWTAIVLAYGTHGLGKAAVGLFEEMLRSGIRPDGAAMLAVLSSCSHAGLVEKGEHYFSAMGRLYGPAPGIEHYSCMVDLLGRAGQLSKCLRLIHSMPVVPDAAIWGSLLGACRIHSDVAMVEIAFKRILMLEPASSGHYVLMSNVYSNAGMMEGVARVRRAMKRRGLRKEPGCSYVEHDGEVHLFLADDMSYPRRDDVYEMLARLEAVVAEGDVDFWSSTAETADDRVGRHSEGLAVAAFSLLSTEAV